MCFFGENDAGGFFYGRMKGAVGVGAEKTAQVASLTSLLFTTQFLAGALTHTTNWNSAVVGCNVSCMIVFLVNISYL